MPIKPQTAQVDGSATNSRDAGCPAAATIRRHCLWSQEVKPALRNIAVAIAGVFMAGAAVDPAAEYRVYERATNGAGDVLETRVAPADEPEVFLNGRQLTRDNAIQFSPAISDRGHYAWAETVNSNHESTIVIDGQPLASSGKLEDRLFFRGETLFWLRIGTTDKDIAVCMLAANRTPKCRPLDFVPDGLIEFGNAILSAGLRPEDGRSVVAIYDPETLAEIGRRTLDGDVVIHAGAVYNVQSTGSVASYLWFYRMLWGKQQREPFAQGNNWLGRVTWNVSYRLLALAKMLDTEPRWELRQRLRHICTAILANIEKADQFATKKYSIDGVSKLHIAVDDALIGLSLMRALSWLPLEEANAVHRFAQEIIAEHEFTWRRGMYFFPKGSRFEFDGIVQPFNQQHALGLLIIELAKKNGEPRYYARVSEMLDAFLGETVMHEGVRLWSYWPKAFYAGWKAEDHLSVNTPTRAPAPDVWFDDTSHGAIVAAFAEEAATLLGKPRPLDIGGIVRRVQSGPFQFYRFMIGAGRQQEASLSWLPPGRMAQSPVLAATYRRWLPRPWVDFDNQDLMESYAVAASAATASGSITIRRLVVGEQMTFAPAIEVSANGGQCTLEEAAGQPERNELCGDILSSVWRSRP